MAKAPIDVRLEKLVAKDPEALARVMTRFMGSTVDALTNLTFDENMNCQWHQFEVTVPSIVTGLVMAGYSKVAAGTSGTTEAIVNYEVSEWDNYAAVIPGATWKFMAPLGGKYLVTTCVTLSAPASGAWLKLMLYKNGNPYKRLGVTQLGTVVTGGSITCAAACMADMAQGDYLDVRQTSNANLNYDTGIDTWIQVTEADTSTFNDPIPAACWPYDFKHVYAKRPRMVLAADVVELADNATVEYGQPDWDFFMTSEGTPNIRIRNIIGLTPGRSYRVTLLIVRD